MVANSVNYLQIQSNFLIEKDWENLFIYAEFSYDTESDVDKLPRINVAGKDNLVTVKSCSQGSIAIGTDGSMKILSGDLNEWIDY